MAIEDELSSDIAIALLTGQERDPERLNNLREVVLKIHASLHQTRNYSYTRRTPSKRVEEIKREQF